MADTISVCIVLLPRQTRQFRSSQCAFRSRFSYLCECVCIYLSMKQISDRYLKCSFSFCVCNSSLSPTRSSALFLSLWIPRPIIFYFSFFFSIYLLFFFLLFGCIRRCRRICRWSSFSSCCFRNPYRFSLSLRGSGVCVARIPAVQHLCDLPVYFANIFADKWIFYCYWAAVCLQ